MVQIELGVLVAIVVFTLGIIGALLSIIYKLHTGTIRDLMTRLAKVEGDVEIKAENLQKKLDDETAARHKKHEESFIRVYGRIETLEKETHQTALATQKQISDLEITTAGFGATYVTRRDLEQLRDESTKRR